MIFRRILIGLALVAGLAAQSTGAADRKPLVIVSGTTKVLPSGDTLKVNPSASGGASLNIPHGTAPSAPNNGDCWTTTGGFYCRINGSTVGPYGTGTGSGSVTSVDVAGGTTGLSTSGGPITGTGTITLTGTLDLDNGGTGATTAAGAATALGLGTSDSPQFTGVNIGHASDTTLARASAGNLTVEGNALYRAGGTDVALADGGTGASLADPNADRIAFWDDSAGAVTWLAPTTGLTITATDISVDATAVKPTESLIVAASDEATAIAAGVSKVTFRMPYAFTVTEVRASLNTAQASGSIFTVDINEGGTSIISTKITIDNTEKTSTTAAAAPVISDSSLADDAEMTVDVDQVGTSGAKGLKVVLIGHRS